MEEKDHNTTIDASAGMDNSGVSVSVDEEEDKMDNDASISNDAVGCKKYAKNERNNLGKIETQRVGRLRIVVYLVILIVAIVVSLGVYVATARAETGKFIVLAV